MARPKKQATVGKPVSTALESRMQEPINLPVQTENLVDSEDELTPHEFEIIKSHATYDYHVGSHVIPAGGVYRLPGDVYRKYSGRPAFDGMFEDGILELL